MNCSMKCRYYTENFLSWCMDNKVIVILSLFSFSLFISTLVLSNQKHGLAAEVEELREILDRTTTEVPTPEQTDTPTPTPVPDTPTPTTPVVSTTEGNEPANPDENEETGNGDENEETGNGGENEETGNGGENEETGNGDENEETGNGDDNEETGNGGNGDKGGNSQTGTNVLSQTLDDTNNNAETDSELASSRDSSVNVKAALLKLFKS